MKTTGIGDLVALFHLQTIVKQGSYLILFNTNGCTFKGNNSVGFFFASVLNAPHKPLPRKKNTYFILIVWETSFTEELKIKGCKVFFVL